MARIPTAPMRWMFVSAVLPALLCAQGLVSVDEFGVRASLRDGSTHVTVAVRNASGRGVNARLALAWLDTADRESSIASRDVVLPPGTSHLDAPLPLASPSIWARLRYRLTPATADARMFAPITGILPLSHIAGHVFELNASIGGSARRGAPLTIHLEAVHPVSRLPVPDAEWTARLSLDGRDLAPKQFHRYPEGPVEITFDVPLTEASEADQEAMLKVSARSGDFDQSVTAQIPVPARLSGKFQSDKPIYQPGQVLHLRALLTDAGGRAASGAQVTLRIEDADNQRVHTAQLKASRFGVVQDDWTIPASASLGVYQATLVAGDDDPYQIAYHAVRVSRYELPSFRVTVKPDRAAYLPSQPARVTVAGAYLFGKPVSRGRVKIMRAKETAAEGEADEDGQFTAEVALGDAFENFRRDPGLRFEDVSLAAYYTDPSSRRTEQRKFDLRVTREPIHIYVIHAGGAGSLPSTVFVSTSYADGRPASANVEIHARQRTFTVETNRYGVGRVELPAGEGRGGVRLTATDSAGQTGVWVEPYWPERTGSLRITTPRTIHKAGEDVVLQLTSPPEAPAAQSVIVHAITDNRRVASRMARLDNHRGTVTFPYQSEFRRQVVFAAQTASRTVIFPGRQDLTLGVATDRSTYKPGERATMRLRVSAHDGKPVEAAVALAVVDQAVLERAKTDDDFGRRPWFACAFCRDDGETEIGGIRLNDLYGLPAAAAIPPELDLAAEALVARSSAYVWSERAESISEAPEFAAIQVQRQRLAAALDEHYAATLEIPEEDSALIRIVGRVWMELADPWGRSYRAEFRVDGEQSVAMLRSAGPDRQHGTADDFVAMAFRRKYFTPVRQLIEQALRKQEDYPATTEAFGAILRETGLLLESMRDPWSTPYRAEVTTHAAQRLIRMSSAGPDRMFRTDDDFDVAAFSGPYFRRETAQIEKALSEAAAKPQTVEECVAALNRAGIDPGSYRDAWGKPYRIASVVASRYEDRVTTSTAQVFGAAPASRTEITPVTRRYVTFSLRSNGADGVENTYDDFDAARFPILLREDAASEPPRAASAQPAALLRGTGAISGTVTDPAGAVIPGATVMLIDAAGARFETASDEQGVYHFTSAPPGTYSVWAVSPGFVAYTVSLIPVTAGKTTNVDIELQVASVMETVTVEAGVVALQTQAASVAAVAAATPRVREYFPETLLWLPEIVTDSKGGAQRQFALADSVTTWKVAAFASTHDGRTAEAEAELRTFQPFFLDFQPPAVLTVGDQIELPVVVRNYRDRAQAVHVAVQPNNWSGVVGASQARVTAPANGSAEVSFTVRAVAVVESGRQRVAARAAGAQDAVEKRTAVHPDGQQVTQTFAGFVAGAAEFPVQIPAAAIPGATRGELRIYPNIASLLLESAGAILTAPHGCAEQTVSAGYANLVALRFARAAGLSDTRVEQRALANIRLAVDSLASFRNYDGGVRYWSSGRADVSVTAYALAFAIEAAAFVPVSRDELAQMAKWLEDNLGGGGWRGERSSSLVTGLVARALAMAKKAGVKLSDDALAAAYHDIARSTDETNEPYLLANFVLAALESGDEPLLADAVAKLVAMDVKKLGACIGNCGQIHPFMAGEPRGVTRPPAWW